MGGCRGEGCCNVLGVKAQTTASRSPSSGRLASFPPIVKKQKGARKRMRAPCTNPKVLAFKAALSLLSAYSEPVFNYFSLDCASLCGNFPSFRSVTGMRTLHPLPFRLLTERQGDFCSRESKKGAHIVVRSRLTEECRACRWGSNFLHRQTFRGALTSAPAFSTQ
jgi:hypothetical protein